MNSYYDAAGYRCEERTVQRRNRKAIRTSRIAGAIMVSLSVLFIALVWDTGEDAGGALMIGALGLYLMFGRFKEGRKRK